MSASKGATDYIEALRRRQVLTQSGRELTAEATGIGATEIFSILLPRTRTFDDADKGLPLPYDAFDARTSRRQARQIARSRARNDCCASSGKRPRVHCFCG